MKYFILLFSIATLLGADPSADIASFKVADGFEVNLFASEKNGIVKPIQMRFDAAGRLWVIGSTVYPQIKPGEVPNDKVIILEDTDRDGRADKSKVYADGLMIPTGIEIGAGGIYLGHGTELLFLPDKNGDDKADAKIPLLRGFGTGDNHQNINSFAWSDAGHLWMCQGLHTLSRVETPWGISELNQAGLWRFRPGLKKLDGFYGSVYEPQNPWGYVFTDWGEPITIAGNNHSIIYPVPGLTSDHFALPPKLIWKNGNGRKCSGGDIVGNNHFPEDWQGKLILGGYLNNAVWSVSILDDGAGFALEDFKPLITTTNRSFRPVDVKFGPDGALYVCDWYNPIIGHYQTSFRHPDRDKEHGRIWRITAKKRPLVNARNLTKLTTAELVRNLGSSNRFARHFSKRELIHRSPSEVTNVLENIGGEFLRKQVLGIFQAYEIPAPKLIEKLTKAKDAGARAYAASAIGLWSEQLPQGIAWLNKLATDQNARVRLQAIVALSYYVNMEAVEGVFAANQIPGSDAFLDYATRQAVFALKPAWLGALEARQPLNKELMSWLIRVDGSSDALASLRKLSKGAAPVDLLRVLAEQGNAEDIAWLLSEKADLLPQLLPAITSTVQARSIAAPKEANELLPELAKQEVLRDGVYILAGIWKVPSLKPEVTQEALASRNGAAIQALGEYGDKETLKNLISEISAIEALAKLDLAAAAKAALAKIETESNVILQIFLERKGGGQALAKALSGKFLKKAVAQRAITFLNQTGKLEPELTQVLKGIVQSEKLKIPGDIIQLGKEIAKSGDSVKGKAVYERPELACATCHRINGTGGVIGPDLSALGTAQPIDFIIGAIIDPQREVKEGFNSVAITLKNGDYHQGYILRDEVNAILLRDTLWNTEVVLQKSNIAERRNNGSLMPPGLVDSISGEEFRDLVKYLSTLGSP